MRRWLDSYRRRGWAGAFETLCPALLLSAVCLSQPTHVWAAVALNDTIPLDPTTNSTGNTSTTISYTVASGLSNTVLIVIVNTRASESISSVVYNTTEPLTLAVATTATGTSNQRVEIWYRISPSTGTHNVVVTYGGTVNDEGIAVMTYTGVDTNSPIGATAVNDATTGTDHTLNITTSYPGSLIVGGVNRRGGGSGNVFTPGAGTTENADECSGTGSNDCYAAGEESSATIGTYTFNFTSGTSNNWAIAAVELKPKPYRLGSSIKASSVTIASTATLDLRPSNTLTLTNNGTPLTVSGALAESAAPTASTVEFAATSGTTTVNARTYGGNLKISGSGGTFNAGGNITVNGNLEVAAGTFALASNELTVGTGSGTGNIFGAGSISQSAVSTTTLKGTGVFGGIQADSCSGANGSFTFSSLAFGDGTNTKTTTVCGSVTVGSSVLVQLNHTLALNGKTWTVNSGDFYGNGTVLCGATDNTCSAGSITLNGPGHVSKYFGGPNSTFTFYDLTTSGNTQTTTAVGNIEVKHVLTISTGHTFDASTVTITLSGSGTPLTRSGTFTRSTSTVTYTSGAGVTALSSAAMTGSNAFYNLKINGTGTFAAGVAVDATNTLDVSAGTLSMEANNLTVGVGSGTGNIFGAGSITQSSAGKTTLYGAGVLGGIQAQSCSGASGAYTFYDMDLGNGSNAKTTTTCGDFTVSNILTIKASHVLDGGSKTITLSGTSGRPFVKTGSFTASSSTVKYTGDNLGGNTTVEPATYYNLYLLPSTNETFVLGGGIICNNVLEVRRTTVGVPAILDTTASNFTILTTGYLKLGAAAFGLKGQLLANGSLIFVTGDLDVNNGDFTQGTGATTVTGNFLIGASSTFTKDPTATGTLTLQGTTKNWTNTNTTIQDVGNVSITGTITATTNVKATTVTVDTPASLTITDKTLTITGSGTPLTLSGANPLSENTSSTVEFAGTATTTVNSRTYGGNLKLNGSGGTFNAGGAIIANGNVQVAAGTLAMGANDLTVGTGSGTGNIFGAGAISQSSPKTTLLKGTGVLGGTQATTCAGANGAYTFYNITLGDGTNAKTTTTCGGFLVAGVLTVNASHLLDGGAYTITLSGSGTPFAMGGADRFTENASTVTYSGSGATNITATTYRHLWTNGTGTYRLPSGTLTVNGVLAILAGALDAATNDASLSIENFGAFGVSLSISAGASFTKGATTAVTFGGISCLWQDLNTPPNDIGAVTINTSVVNCGGLADTVVLNSSVKATSVTVNTGKALKISGYTLTLTGSGTPLVITGTLTENSSSTVEFASTSGTATVNSRTYGGGLKINGSGGTFDTGGNVTVTGTLTDSAGTFRVGTNHTVTAANVTINGGSLSMPNSGSILKISNSGVLSMSSGTFSTSNVATTPQMTTSDTVTPTIFSVNFAGGTLEVAELAIDYVTTFQLGSGVTITQFDNVTWGSNTLTGPGIDVILDITGKTANLLGHIFPATSSKECNVRANTSGTVTMWDWTGGFGGEENDCDSGGEVIWKGGAGGVHDDSGSSGYPAIY